MVLVKKYCQLKYAATRLLKVAAPTSMFITTIWRRTVSSGNMPPTGLKAILSGSEPSNFPHAYILDGFNGVDESLQTRGTTVCMAFNLVAKNFDRNSRFLGSLLGDSQAWLRDRQRSKEDGELLLCQLKNGKVESFSRYSTSLDVDFSSLHLQDDGHGNLEQDDHKSSLIGVDFRSLRLDWILGDRENSGYENHAVVVVWPSSSDVYMVSCAALDILEEKKEVAFLQQGNSSSGANGRSWNRSWNSIKIAGFNWKDYPALMSEALENGWAAFALSQVDHGVDHRPHNQKQGFHAETRWEVGPGTELMQILRSNPGIPIAEISSTGSAQFFKSALPLPGPFLGIYSYPQESYIEITVLGQCLEVAKLLALAVESHGWNAYATVIVDKLLREERFKDEAENFVHLALELEKLDSFGSCGSSRPKDSPAKQKLFSMVTQRNNLEEVAPSLLVKVMRVLAFFLANPKLLDSFVAALLQQKEQDGWMLLLTVKGLTEIFANCEARSLWDLLRKCHAEGRMARLKDGIPRASCTRLCEIIMASNDFDIDEELQALLLVGEPKLLNSFIKVETRRMPTPSNLFKCHEGFLALKQNPGTLVSFTKLCEMITSRALGAGSFGKVMNVLIWLGNEQLLEKLKESLLKSEHALILREALKKEENWTMWPEMILDLAKSRVGSLSRMRSPELTRYRAPPPEISGRSRALHWQVQEHPWSSKACRRDQQLEERWSLVSVRE
ncbi:hypothetical protein SELMODRAFT_403305 [Selaginella moellendorffii]|uniref:Uncharacterized protein n=1 Tax=Selaginella moellendorffii TaxID=88036 RepID=D8QTR1_SELML|nr:hypothetical protein SELMODRAFT_403305 [Selaginella moellendorffii]